nr:MAG TPA: High-affinity nitrate transporter accessory [Caudoviricetes sp.]
MDLVLSKLHSNLTHQVFSREIYHKYFSLHLTQGALICLSTFSLISLVSFLFLFIFILL